MNTKRFWQLLIAILVVVAVVFAFQLLHIPSSATRSSNYVGMGDLRRVEAAQALPKTGASERIIGMGCCLDAVQALPKTVASEPYIGMGCCLKAPQALPKTGDSNPSYVGIGDLHRYEFEQEGKNK